MWVRRRQRWMVAAWCEVPQVMEQLWIDMGPQLAVVAARTHQVPVWGGGNGPFKLRHHILYKQIALA